MAPASKPIRSASLLGVSLRWRRGKRGAASRGSSRIGREPKALLVDSLANARSPSSALLPFRFWGEGSPTKIDYRRKKRGYPYSTSLLEDLVMLPRAKADTPG